MIRKTLTPMIALVLLASAVLSGIVARQPTLALEALPTATRAEQPAVIAIEDVNVYALTDTHSRVLETLHAHEQLPVLGISSDKRWFLVVTPDGVGWITAAQTVVQFTGDLDSVPILRLLASASPAPGTNTATSTAAETATSAATDVATTATPDLTEAASELIALVAGNSAYKIVRSAPTVYSAVTALVAPGVTVVLTQKAAGDSTNPNVPWYYARLPDGTRGWMRADVLDILGPPTPPGTTATPTATYTPGRSLPAPQVSWGAGTRLKISNANGAWLRSRPSASAGQVATLAYQNPVTATGNRHFDGRQWWWEVRADWGAVGWVEQASLAPN